MAAPFFPVALGSLLAISLPVAAPAAAAAETVLFAIDAGTDTGRIESRDAELAITDGSPAMLRISAGTKDKWPGITLRPAAGRWDFSAFEYGILDIRNAGQARARVGLRVDSAAADGTRSTMQTTQELAPGELRSIRVPLERKVPRHLEGKLLGMRGYPAGLNPDKGIDAAAVAEVLVFVSGRDVRQTIECGSLRAGGKYDGGLWFDPAARHFPMIDRYGQYLHRDWPGKTRGDEDLQRQRAAEERELAERSGPDGWNAYGGWQSGPQLEATGRFRVQKHEGKWWLVDPEGRLFWSHGIDCVRSSTAYTPITDREFYFAELPERDSPLATFYGRGSWAPHGYYQDKGEYETFNFTGANLQRKFGPEWAEAFPSLCHRRLRSWGLNTIANWSDPDVYRLERTPYVVTVQSGRAVIEGSTGYWGKFPDPFDPRFIADTKRNAMSAREETNSRWCLGVFVDNELAWGDEGSLAASALASPRAQAAKQAIVDRLRGKYADVAALNAAWGTDHASWDALLDSQTPPDKDRARNDLADGTSWIADQYFDVCRAAVREAAPQTLYLGCRFAWVNDRAVRSAATRCDVVGFNKYQDSVADFRLPDGVDIPAIIGEFHFGALDRGMFHTGLRATADQDARAAAYRDYVRGALRHPQWVGTHWFQYGDQATTGRGDGENYQIGFLDVCDRPYPEIVQASREVARTMYSLRSER